MDENRVIDAMLMGIKMKRMNGLKATKLVKHNYPNIHVFIYGSHSLQSYGIKLLESEATNYFTKGGEMSKMIGTIKECIF